MLTTAPSVPDLSSIIPQLLEWYGAFRRTLPWRAEPGATPDPYHVWLSEIMLQQTSVATIKQRFTSFLARFPTIEHLARADEQAVLREWAGLGYYARARNMHRCAQMVAGRDCFPCTVDGLRSLPGIGAYTATAIAAIAFGLPGIPIDGNVERILCRLAAIEVPPRQAALRIAALARALGATAAAVARPSDTAQALFDLGATICTPARPACGICPVRPQCLAAAQGLQERLPARVPRGARPVRHGVSFFLQDRHGQVLLRRRPARGLLGGMSELPGTEWTDDPPEEAVRLAAAPAQASWRHAGQVRHVFTHFELRLDVYAASLAEVPGASPLAEAALPTLMRKCATLAVHSLVDGPELP